MFIHSVSCFVIQLVQLEAHELQVVAAVRIGGRGPRIARPRCLGYGRERTSGVGMDMRQSRKEQRHDPDLCCISFQ